MKVARGVRRLWPLVLLAPLAAQAQTYSRTDTIVYSDNLGKWVLGQALSSTNTNTGVIESRTDYDPVTALPLKHYGPGTAAVPGKLKQTLTYNTDGTLATVKDGNNNVTTLSSWYRGIPRTIKYPITPESPSGATQTAVVNSQGWITAITDENGYKTCYAYDVMGRMAEITYPSETTASTCDTTTWNKTSFVFEKVAGAEYGIPGGHWRQTVSSGNARRIAYFDGRWRPLVTREYDAANEAATKRFQRFAYDYEGRAIFASYPGSSDALTAGTWTSYDALGRVTSVAQDTELTPGLQVATTEYLTGFKTRVTNPRGQQTTTSYMVFDAPSIDLPVLIEYPLDTRTVINRTVLGQTTSLVRRNGAGTVTSTRSYTLNGNQELCRTADPETGATLMGYDGAGNLTTYAAGLASTLACATANTRTVSRTYDARNRITDLSFPDGNGNQHWTYTADGLPSTVSTSNGGNTVSNTYTYNRRRLLTGESLVPDTANTWVMGYGYNSLGQITTEAYPASVQVNYTVNALGQTTQASIGVPAQGTNTVVASNASYYPNGALKQFTYGNGIVHSMTQNARQLPSRSTDGTVLDLGTSFDPNGNVSGVTDYTSTARQTKSMVYDNLDRLTSATSPMFGTASYTYDTLDNLKTVVAPGRNHTYVYDTATNRLTNVTNTIGGASVIGLAYDVQGNLANKNSVVTTFDYGNRLRSSLGLAYRYDALGRRARQDIAGAQLKYTHYVKDGRLVWQRDESVGKRISNVYLAGSLVAEFNRPIGSTTETLTYLHTDALGSPIAKTNAVGSLIETSEYEPYGKLLNRANDDRAGYTGHVMDAGTGLTYMQQRYYDPMIGRFLSVDPVTANSATGVNFNRYWYANNNPYRFTDPDGRYAGSPSICERTPLRCKAVIPVNPSSSGSAPRKGQGMLAQNGSSSQTERTVRSYGDLPSLPPGERSADGNRFVGEGWEETERYTGRQEIRWNEVGSEQWTLFPISQVTLFFKSNPVGKLVIPDILVAKQSGFLGMEYQRGYKHVLISYQNGTYEPNRDIYLGFGTIWTSEKYWKVDPSPTGTVYRPRYDADF